MLLVSLAKLAYNELDRPAEGDQLANAALDLLCRPGLCAAEPLLEKPNLGADLFRLPTRLLRGLQLLCLGLRGAPLHHADAPH